MSKRSTLPAAAASSSRREVDGGAWQADARCASVPNAAQLFFPGTTRTVSPLWAAPVRICGRCPVRAECLDDALQMEGELSIWYRHGVFGGKTPAERYEIACGQSAARTRQPGAALKTEGRMAG